MIDISVEGTALTPSESFLATLNPILEQILSEFHQKQRTFSLTFCDDPFIQELNASYRNKNYATDVLSFAMDDDDEFIFEFSSLGDIIVSTDTAQRQADEFDVPYEEELARLVIHGLLHLLGFDHELGEKEHQEMFHHQDRFMDIFMQKFSGTNSSHI